MEIEAKIANSSPKKSFFFAWDRSKYRFAGTHIRLTLVALFSFFLAYTLITAMNRADAEQRTSMSSPSTYSIPSLISSSSVVAPQPGKGPAGHAKGAGAKTSFTGPEVIYREVGAIPPGTLVKAKLVTGASDGPVRAALVQDVTVNGETLLESGTAILGSGSSTEDRLVIRFDRMVKKDGTTLSIQAQAFDGQDHIAGLKGNKVGTEAMKLAAGIGLNFVGGMSDALQDTQISGGMAVRQPSVKNALLGGAAAAAIDESRDLISSYRDKLPRIEVGRGKIIEVMFDSSK